MTCFIFRPNLALPKVVGQQKCTNHQSSENKHTGRKLHVSSDLVFLVLHENHFSSLEDKHTFKRYITTTKYRHSSRLSGNFKNRYVWERRSAWLKENGVELEPNVWFRRLDEKHLIVIELVDVFPKNLSVAFCGFL